MPLAKIILLLAPLSVLSAQPRRIVSTAPSVTEMLYALELGDRVVGVTTFCRYPPDAAQKAKVGTYLRPDLEAVAALRPDLVVAERSPLHASGWPQALRLNVLEVEHNTIAGIYESIERIGDATGVQDRARALAVSIRRELDQIRRRTGMLPRRRILFIVGRTPGKLEDLIAAGKSSYLEEVMGIAGAQNIFRDSLAAYPKVSIEGVLAGDPEVIIDMGDMAETVGVTEEQKRTVVRLWDRYPMLTAVKQRRVFAVASDIFVVPGPRVVEAARKLARMLHPEAEF